MKYAKGFDIARKITQKVSSTRSKQFSYSTPSWSGVFGAVA
jgi:hypothetical protein